MYEKWRDLCTVVGMLHYRNESTARFNAIETFSRSYPIPPIRFMAALSRPSRLMPLSHRLASLLMATCREA